MWNRERQSLSQSTQLASKLNLDNPGLVHAVKHVATARKSATYIIFNRGYGPTVNRTTTVEARARTRTRHQLQPSPKAQGQA